MSPKVAAGGRPSTPPPAEPAAADGLRALPPLVHAAEGWAGLRAALAEWLVANGYKRVEAVEYPGEFGRRGGICDVFPPDAPDPVRVEFFGDEVESIRTFSTGTQRSLGNRDAVTLLGVEPPDPKAH